MKIPKLVLASYFQPENHGAGRKIGITPGKPKDIECDTKFDPISPEQLYWDYMKYKKEDPVMAGKAFDRSYREKLDEFTADVQKTATEENKTVFDVLPFQDGDTLLSWENKGNMTFRKITAEYLRKLGYEVEEN
jgi:hypothetical protein